MSPRLNHITNWLELAQQTDWSAKALAQKCGVSRNTLERHFVATLGKPPKTWLMEQRLDLARQKIESGELIKNVAGSLSFKNISHLTNGYKKHWGHAPTKKMNLIDLEC